jgi:hypothetical protein
VLGTSTWASIAAGLAFGVLLLLIARACGRPGPDDGDDGHADGSDGGWGAPRRPRRPPPVGPVCWADFERQFAAYVAGSGGRTAEHSGQPSDRAVGPPA